MIRDLTIALFLTMVFAALLMSSGCNSVVMSPGASGLLDRTAAMSYSDAVYAQDPNCSRQFMVQVLQKEAAAWEYFRLLRDGKVKE